MDQKQKIFQLMSKTNLTVISTINLENKPQSAVIEFGQTDDLEIVFDTFDSARKYKNLAVNKQVSFVIGWDENITIQYEGWAEELKGQDLKEYTEVFFSKNPDARRWLSKGVKYFKVTPTWIRYSDLNKNPWEVFELTKF